MGMPPFAFDGVGGGFPGSGPTMSALPTPVPMHMDSDRPVTHGRQPAQALRLAVYLLAMGAIAYTTAVLWPRTVPWCVLPPQATARTTCGCVY